MADGTSFPRSGGRTKLAVDLFAGGGGASLGMARAYRHPDIAINHNAVAIAVHTANHAAARHYVSDIFEVAPAEATNGAPVAITWLSPDCRHHSRAKGGTPRDKKIRGLAWVALRWAYETRCERIMLENVPEFQSWQRISTLSDTTRRGETFRAFIAALSTGLPARHPAHREIRAALGDSVPKDVLVRGLGYTVDYRELVAADYGAPTIRTRLYLVARNDGKPIVWPARTHAPPEHLDVLAGKLLPWKTAADCIDFSLPANSIFTRKKELAPNTKRRIAKGLWRYVLDTPTPFLVSTRPGDKVDRAIAAHLATLRGTSEAHLNGRPLGEPLNTVSAQGTHHALIAAHVTKFRANAIGSAANAPLPTITAGGEMVRPAGAAHALGLVSAYVTPLTHQGERRGHALKDPAPTVTAAHRGELALVGAFMEQANGGFYDGDGRTVRDPVSTVTTSGANQRLVSAYLIKYYKEGGQWQECSVPMHTIPTKARMGLVSVVQLAVDHLPTELLARARRCAAFLREQLPERFPEPADVVLVGEHVLVDITLRMLVPRELARAQGFPADYILEVGVDGRPVSKTDQIRLIGNSVCPDVAEALIRANVDDPLPVRVPLPLAA